MDRVTNYYGNIIVYMHGIGINEVSTAVMKRDPFQRCKILLNSR